MLSQQSFPCLMNNEIFASLSHTLRLSVLSRGCNFNFMVDAFVPGGLVEPIMRNIF